MDPTKQKKGFASVGAQMAAPAPSMDQAAASTTDATEEDQPTQFSTEDWAQLLHNLGTGMQKANPDIEAALKSMLGPDIDYSKEAEPLRQAIANRPTTPMPGGIATTLAGFASPTAAARIEQQRAQSQSETSQKEQDREKLIEDLTNKHISDLERKGKFQESLATILMTQGLSEARARQRASEAQQREKLRGAALVRTARERAQAISQRFNLDDKMRLKLLDIAGRLAGQQASRVGQVDKITGDYMVPQEQYDSTLDDIVSSLYETADSLRKGGKLTPNKEPQKQEGPKPKLGFAEWKAKQAAGKK